MNTKKIKEIGKDLIGIAQDYEDTDNKEELNDLEQDLINLKEELEQETQGVKNGNSTRA